MNILYFWIRNHKNIEHLGFNFSSKVTFETTIEDTESYPDETLTITLNIIENSTDNVDIFPSNIIDVKAILGENGSGKSNLLFWLINFIMNDKTNAFGFLITDKFVIVRDKIVFNSNMLKLFGKPLKIIYPEDIANFDRGPYKNKISRKDAFLQRGKNLMDTYFKNNYFIFYSTSLNQDNYFNSEGLQNSYFLWQSENLNYFDISTESLIVSDYDNHRNTPNYFVTGESELLAFKYSESLRILNFLSEEDNMELSIRFPVHSINVGFTGFNERFWDSIDSLISPNSTLERRIENILRFDDIYSSTLNQTDSFLEQFRQEIMYCLMSFQLKEYYSFTSEHEFPLFKLVQNLEMYYDSSLDPYESIYNYIRQSENFSPENEYLVHQIKNTVDYFITKFSTGEIIPNGYNGMIIPKHHIKTIIKDFLQQPLYILKLTTDPQSKWIKPNMFGFDLHGLSNGERSFLSLFSRLFFYKDRILTHKDILFLIDEGELGFHPQWQKEYFKLIIDFLSKLFPNNKIQLIITSHSPFLASDLPKENIIFLQKDEDLKTKIGSLTKHTETFAANIHSLYSDAFFLQGATIGSFSKDILDEIVDYLKGDKQNNEFNSKYRAIIQKIGEPIIKNKLEEMWIQKLGREEEISLLEARINYLKSL